MSEEVTVLRAPARFTLGELAERMRGPLEAAGAERAIVFGSWARGEADGYSDLDLLVVLQTDLPRFERGKLLSAVLDAIPIPVDLLVYTPEEFARGTARGFEVFDAIAREGVTIHERREG
jgi:predicted nucleotidyltransferase